MQSASLALCILFAAGFTEWWASGARTFTASAGHALRCGALQAYRQKNSGSLSARWQVSFELPRSDRPSGDGQQNKSRETGMLTAVVNLSAMLVAVAMVAAKQGSTEVNYVVQYIIAIFGVALLVGIACRRSKR